VGVALTSLGDIKFDPFGFEAALAALAVAVNENIFFCFMKFSKFLSDPRASFAGKVFRSQKGAGCVWGVTTGIEAGADGTAVRRNHEFYPPSIESTPTQS
jgi:hypothetical protein